MAAGVPWSNPVTKWSTLWEYGPGDWVRDALCSQVDTDLFFPEKGQASAPAKLICRRCPVIADCLQFALDHNIKEGVWGGTSERQRRELRGQRREPDLGPDRFDEKFYELRALGYSDVEIGRRMKITEDSLARQMYRYGIQPSTGLQSLSWSKRRRRESGS